MLITPKMLMACDIIRAIKVLPRNGNGKVQNTEICKMYGFEIRYPESVLQEMNRLGLTVSGRGPAGGYMLTERGKKISFFDLVNKFISVDRVWLLAFCEEWKNVNPVDVSKARHPDAAPEQKSKSRTREEIPSGFSLS